MIQRVGAGGTAPRHELDDFVGHIAGHAVVDAPPGEDPGNTFCLDGLVEHEKIDPLGDNSERVTWCVGATAIYAQFSSMSPGTR